VSVYLETEISGDDIAIYDGNGDVNISGNKAEIMEIIDIFDNYVQTGVKHDEHVTLDGQKLHLVLEVFEVGDFNLHGRYTDGDSYCHEFELTEFFRDDWNDIKSEVLGP